MPAHGQTRPDGNQAALRDSALLQGFADQLRLGIAIVAADGTILFVNAACADLVGAPVAALTGTKFCSLVHPDDISAVTAVLAATPGATFEHRLSRGVGTWRLVETTRSGQSDALGGTVLTLRDTGRRAANRAVMAAQREHLDRQLHFARALNRMAETVASLDEAQAVLDALVRIIGEGLRLDRCLILDIDATDDLAKGLSEWLSDANGEAFSVKHDYPLDLFRRSHDYMWMRRCAIHSHFDEIHPCLAGEGSAPLVHGREGGQHHVKSLIWHPFCFRPDGYFLLVANLTEQRRAWAPEEIAFIEAAANQVNLALQKMRILGERVQVEERLRQSQKMEAIGRLAGGIAHDFNNLLTAIIGYADLLRQQVPDDHPLRRHVDGILQVTDRAAATTRQLLSFSRRQVIRARNLDLNDLVDELQRLLRRLIGETIILDVQVADEPLRVRVDPGQLELALVNLAVNARDAMPRGGRLTLATSVYRVDDAAARRLGVPAGDMAAIRVADTGVGMDQDTIRHLFEPFFTTKAMGKGTGLGLSSVYGIVSAAGGAITVDSQPGRGSSFTILLPFASAVETPTAARAAPGSPPPVLVRSAETVVLAEDDAVLRELLGNALTSHGHCVISAADGEQALALAGAHAGPIHLLIADLVMPSIDGQTLARALLRQRPGMRVLFMSGYASETAFDPVLSNQALITKPFSIDDLLRAVRSALSGQTGSRLALPDAAAER
jgi:signal transduction histidine kinase/CheY-like chemotaxis protein